MARDPHRPGGTFFDPDDSLLSPDDQQIDVEVRGHLTQIKPLGKGGMGEVWLALDERLDREVALKLLGPRLAANPEAAQRFLAEAKATAQLAHPGIVGVHEVGIWEDGRPYYTMDVIRGETLEAQIRAHHDGTPTLDGLNRLVDRFRRACEAIGYAHSRGVIHRDLKPENILIGAFGHVLVADWGLVRADPDAAEPLRLDRSPDQTVGMSGTPRYMSPEQVLGLPIGPASDVFSLGSVLAYMLSGVRAFPQDDVHDVLAAVSIARATFPTSGPEPLLQITRTALALEPADRFPDAGVLADAVGSYLDGARRRARALAEVQRARDLEPRIAALKQEAAAAQARADAALEGVEPWMPLDRKVAGWRHEDAAEALLREAAELEELRIDQAEAALSHERELPEALDLLADHHKAQLDAAEAIRNRSAARAAERRLRRFDRGRHAAALAGKARLTLHTEPPGARVTCRRYALEDRQLVPVDPVDLGRTPLVAVELDAGSYELTLERDGHHPTTLPISLRREQHLDHTRPGDPEPHPIPLLPLGQLGPDDCYVPAGWCWRGASDLDFTTEPARREWVDGFVIQRFPVTNADYLAFLDDVLATEGEQAALRWVPRERSSKPNEPGPACYGRSPEGGFALVPDADGDLWDPRWPVMLVDWHSAVAYGSWLAKKTGHDWQLPTFAQWEKAGRGADGRLFPWGWHSDPALMCVRESHHERLLPAPIDAYPTDRSPYGVRGLAGNMRDWLADVADEAGNQRAIRGGCWFFGAKASMLPLVYAMEAHRRGDTIGFRLARPLGQ